MLVCLIVEIEIDDLKIDLLLINHHRHTSLAMLSLRAIKPHGSSVINHNRICRCGRGSSCDRHETRVDSDSSSVHGNGLTWLIECRLCDGMVCGCELELYHFSDFGDEVVR